MIGYWLTVFFIDKWGRIPIQKMGFAVLLVVLLVLSLWLEDLKAKSQNTLFAIYCTGLVFFNFGPNATTFIIPGEIFPTRFRSTV